MGWGFVALRVRGNTLLAIFVDQVYVQFWDPRRARQEGREHCPKEACYCSSSFAPLPSLE